MLDDKDFDVELAATEYLSAFVDATPIEGDYIKDGILYCGKCHSPRQTKPYENRDLLIGVLCGCRAEENEKRRSLKEQEKKRQRIEKERARSMHSEAWRDMRFVVDDGHNPQITAICRRYVENFESAKAANLGLLFLGDVP